MAPGIISRKTINIGYTSPKSSSWIFVNKIRIQWQFTINREMKMNWWRLQDISFLLYINGLSFVFIINQSFYDWSNLMRCQTKQKCHSNWVCLWHLYLGQFQAGNVFRVYLLLYWFFPGKLIWRMQSANTSTLKNPCQTLNKWEFYLWYLVRCNDKEKDMEL